MWLGYTTFLDMTTNETTSEHPVSKELIDILRHADFEPNPEDPNFEYCPLQ
jgi:hypothetical protein